MKWSAGDIHPLCCRQQRRLVTTNNIDYSELAPLAGLAARERLASIRHKFESSQEEGHACIASCQSPRSHNSSSEVASGRKRADQPSRGQAVVQQIGC